LGPDLPAIFGWVGAGRISYRNRIRPLGKWTSWTVLRVIQQRLRRLVLALADEAQIFVPVAHGGEMDGAALLGAVAALVEPVEDGDGEARVVAVAGDGGPVGAGDGLGDPLEHLLPGMVGERPARELVGGVPAGGEHAVALGERVSRGAAHAGIFAGGADPAGVGDGLEEELAQERAPAVAADALGRAALVGLEEVADQPPALLFGGEVFGVAQRSRFGLVLGKRRDAGIVGQPAGGRGVRGEWFFHVVLLEPYGNINEGL
jgi:hypothetical protein